MTDIWLGLGVVFGGIFAWLLKGFFADRKISKLEKQRDAAAAEAKNQKIRANVKTAEAEGLKQQQKREDEIHGADNNSVSDSLDNMFKR